MRMLAEIISSEVEVRNIKNRKDGSEKPTQIFVIHAVDTDFGGQMYKISVWENFSTIVNKCLKGTILEVRFRNVRPANNYEKVDQISATEDNIRIKKSAAEAVREMQQLLARQEQAEKQQVQPMAASQ